MRKLRENEYVDENRVIRRSGYSERTSYKGGLTVFLIYIGVMIIVKLFSFKYFLLLLGIGIMGFSAWILYGKDFIKIGAKKAVEYFVVENPIFNQDIVGKRR